VVCFNNKNEYCIKHPKLYQLLSAFSKSELRAFRVFLQSPYCNKSPILLKLFDVLKIYHPHFNSPRLSREKIYEKLKESTPFSEKFIVDRFSDLTKRVEQFLAHQQLKIDKPLFATAYRKSLYSHQLSKYFLQESKKAITAIENKTDYSWEVAFESWKLKNDCFMDPRTEKWDDKRDDSVEIIGHLDEAYLILKLRCAFHQKTRGTIFKKNKSNIFLDAVITHAKSYDHPVIRLYSLLLMTFEVKEFEKKWIEAHDFYKKNFNLLPIKDQNAGLIGLINRAYKLALAGQASFHGTNLDLFKFGLQNNILLPGGFIDPQVFKNISLLGASRGQIDWTTNFIKKYQCFLPTDTSPNLVFFSQAYLSFYQQEYETCLDWISKSVEMNTRDKINFKSLSLRCWYEKYSIDRVHHDFLMSLLDKDNQFLQRKKNDLSSEVVKAYQNFLYLLKLLTNITHSSTKNRRAGIQKIKKEFSKRQYFLSKEWLEKKIQVLTMIK